MIALTKNEFNSPNSSTTGSVLYGRKAAKTRLQVLICSFDVNQYFDC